MPDPQQLRIVSVFDVMLHPRFGPSRPLFWGEDAPHQLLRI
jgi:hypothetical protein